MNYYDILKVSKTASQQEIRDSYKALIKKYHPDIYQGDHQYAEKITKDLNDAYDVLSNEELRKEYDLSLETESSSYTETSSNSSVYNAYKYYSQAYRESQNSNQYTNEPKENIEQIMKEKIYKIVDEKTANMSKKSKILLVILIILFALLFTALSILDFLRIMKM